MNPFLDNIDRYPINIVRGGEGAALFDEADNRYLDFWSDESTQGLGYGVEVQVAVATALENPHQLPDIFPNPVRTKLAERLCLTYGFNKVFFSNSGAEAIETAIKVARKYWWNSSTGKHKKMIYTAKGNFHGRTLGALSVSDSYGSGSPYHKSGFSPTWEGEFQYNWPGYGVFDPEAEDWGINPDITAAIIMAPILGNNCVKIYGAEILQKVRDYCTKNHILLIFDEIQTGSGWTGFPSAALYYGVQPDIMTLGKRIALGFPMSATLFGTDIGDAIGKGEHFNTFAGSPFVCSLADQWLDWLEGIKDGAYTEQAGYEIIEWSGRYLEKRLRDMPQVAEVNRVGMMMSFLPKYEGYTEKDLCTQALDHGLLIVTHRANGEIRFTPPCATPFHQLTEGCDKLERAFRGLA